MTLTDTELDRYHEEFMVAAVGPTIRMSASYIFYPQDIRRGLKEALERYDEDSCDLVASEDVAELADVNIDTVRAWRKRDVMPAPYRVFARTPVWRRVDIIEWLIRTGRAV